MPSLANQNQLKILREKIAQAQSTVIVDYCGTNVNEQVSLRQEIKKVGGEFLITKNTLMNLMFNRPEMKKSLQGMNAVVFSYQDPINAIKVLFNFQKENEKLTIKQGLMDGKVLTEMEVKVLSELPSKNELIAMLLNLLQSPATKLVNVLKAGPRNLVYALKAISDQKAN